jgi:S-adenosyl-L-methionine hydrolase (adenosine-forming)
MAIITFTSDFGTKDHYVAAVKAKIFNYNPTIQVIDISHSIEKYNIAHGSFVLNSVFRDFPKGTVHLVAINSLSDSEDKFIAAKIEDHFFVGTDNGLFHLLTEKASVSVDLWHEKDVSITFPEKNIFAFAAVSLASGKNIYDLGTISAPLTSKKLINRQLKITPQMIEGMVIHVDSYGNLITNISKKVFLQQKGEKKAIVCFGRELYDKINANYSNVNSGDCVLIFNDLGYLEIAIKNGNASQLLGLKYDSTIRVEFV